MIGLLDCNNFYVSCERVFNPDLRGKPVIVLSSNDGCVIARSEESKALGIKMGIPLFQIKELVKIKKVTLISANSILYGDMSTRVMRIISEDIPEVEIYSIDEAFLNLDGIENIEEYARKLVTKIEKYTGIPVSIGIAETKTLAKVAAGFAKKYSGYKRVCIIDNEEKRLKALKLLDVNDIWGIGKAYSKKLNSYGILTALDFAKQNRDFIRRIMTVVGEQIWLELNNTKSANIKSIPSERKQICTSRSFGKTINNLDALSEAVANFASICATKLRKERGLAVSLMVFIDTNKHRQELPQYFNSSVYTLNNPTSDTIEITSVALKSLRKIYKEDYEYKKAGVIIIEITSAKKYQPSLFNDIDRGKRDKLMQTMDQINKDDNLLKVASAGGISQLWGLNKNFISPSYTTKLNETIIINCLGNKDEKNP